MTAPAASSTMGATSRFCSRLRLEVTPMTWEVPDFVEVKMDAEINSYQDDFGQEPDDRF